MMKTIDFQTHRLDDDQRKQLDRSVDYFNKAQELVLLVDSGACDLPFIDKNHVDVDKIYSLGKSSLPLILVTGCQLSDNWFSHAQDGLGLLTLADWQDAFIDKTSVINAAPDANILTSLILTALLVLAGDLGDYDVLHVATTGCLFDFCQHKPDRIFKMRSAFVCPTCTSKLAQHGLSSLDLDAAHSVLECVRNLLLGRTPQARLPEMPGIDACIRDAGRNRNYVLPPNLVNACRKNSITLLVGSGLSLQSDVGVIYNSVYKWKRLPTWTEVPMRMAHCLEAYTGRQIVPRETQTLDEFLADLDFYRESLGELLYYPRAIFDIFTPRVSSVGLLNQLVFKLPLRSVLTTNYDFVLQCAAPVGSPVFTWREARAAREYLAGSAGQIPIIKLHGCGSRPDTVVLTRLEYERLRLDAEYLSLLRSLFDNQTILFIGFGFNDPRDLDHIFREAQLAGAAIGEKFAIMPAERCKDVRSKFPQVQTIGINTHDELSPVIAALIEATTGAHH